MARNRKTVYKGFDYLHCDDFAAYLEEMASKGWHFKEWSAGLVFEKGEPEAATYAVEVFIDGTEYDTRPEPHTKEFAEYCEAAGWKLIDARQKFCIFKKVSDDALEILTPQERLSNIAKETQKSVWRHLGIAAVWTAMQWFDFTGFYFVNSIFSNQDLMITGTWTLLFLIELCRCIHFYTWKFFAERKIARGEDVYLGKRQKSGLAFYSWHGWAGCGAFVLYLFGCLMLDRYEMVIFCAAYLGILLVMGFLISKFRPEANTNAIIQNIVPMLLLLGIMVFSIWLVYEEDTVATDPGTIPLLYEDIGGDAGALEDSTYDTSTSLFGSKTTCLLSYEDVYIYYYVYKTEHDWILDKIWEEESSHKRNKSWTDCAADWNAEAAFRNQIGCYYARYADSILIFDLEEDVALSREQIEIIRAALDLR